MLGMRGCVALAAVILSFVGVARGAEDPWTLTPDIPIVSLWPSAGRLVEQPVTADLYRPRGIDDAARLPAAVIINSSGGVTAATEHYYARLLARQGMAALVVDSFGPRGVRRTTDDQSRVWQSQSDADAAAGFRWLAAQPWADASRIVVLGMSRGGSAALSTALLTERRRLRMEDVRFAAHVAITTGGCGIQAQDARTTGAPIFFMLAELDDYTPVRPCLDYAERMRAAGNASVRLAVYPGVYHAHEAVGGLQEAVVELGRNCSFLRDASGRLIRPGTGEIVPQSRIRAMLLAECTVQAPVTIGGDPRVKTQSSADLLQFLRDAGLLQDREAMTAVPDCATFQPGILRRNCERARAGWSGDLVALARAHRYPTRGFAGDDAVALRLFRLAAGREHPAARWELALMLRDGRGVEKDVPEALRLARLAAEAGEPAAMNILGVMARDGTGQARDDTAAAAWFRRAAELRHGYGLANLGRMHWDGRGGLALDRAEAVRLWRKSAFADNPLAQVLLAQALRSGEGVARNVEEAASLLRAAAGQDQDPSARRRAQDDLARLSSAP